MDWTEALWGAVVVGAGIFIAVYGTMLFRFALAAMGFGVGFIGGWWLLDDQESAMRMLISLVAGAIVAVVCFSLIRFGVYIAGAILGMVIGVVVIGAIDIFGPTLDSWLRVVVVGGGLAGGGVLGPRLGNLIIVLATSAAGAFMVVDGLQIWFASRIGGDLDDPSQTMAQKLTLVVFLVILGIAALSQNESARLRRRLRN